MKYYPYAVIFALISIFATGCSQIKKLDQMAQSTEDLKTNTQKMAQDTSTVRENLIGLNGTTDAVDVEGLQGGGVQVRTYTLERMLVDRQLTDKDADAGIYMSSFDYNFWGLNPRDNQDALDAAKAMAVDEFLSKIKSMMVQLDLLDTDGVNLKPGWEEAFALLGDHPFNFDFTVTPSKSTRGNLYAFALALHIQNDKMLKKIQERNPKFEGTSMIKIVQDGLRYGKRLRKREIELRDIPDWAKKVLEKEVVAEYLLQLRHNLLPGYVLQELRGYRDLGTIGQALQAKWGERSNGKKWDPKLESLDNAVLLDKLNQALKESLRVRGFLREVFEDSGRTVMVDEALLQTLENMKNPLNGSDTNLKLLDTQLSAKAKGQFYELVLEVMEPLKDIKAAEASKRNAPPMPAPDWDTVVRD